MIRLLRIEARHNPTVFVLPLLAALLFVTPLARDLQPVALWLDRSVDVEGSIQLVGPFAAGTAAWQASRERRRAMTDLMASTPLNPWRRAVATWLISLGSMVAFYLLLCAVFLGVTANQPTWGAPQWWPVVDGLIALVMCSAAGFAIGLRFPSRFTTPLVAIGTLAVILGVRSATTKDLFAGLGLLSPIYPTFGLDASVFYVPQPDLSILKMICYAGILAMTIGSTIWYFRAERPRLRPIGGTALVIGLVLTATAAVLDTTARSSGHGIIVPAFHDAATDHAVAYTPVCSHTAVLVCVHPAYAGGHELEVLVAAIDPVVEQVRGIPGMPVRVDQVADSDIRIGVHGSPPVLSFASFIVHGTTMQPPEFTVFFSARIALSLFTDSRQATQAQRALATYLLNQAHLPTDAHLLPPDPAGTAAATRFATQPATTRTAWLTTHLAQIRAGQLTITDIP